MRWSLRCWMLVALCSGALSANAATGRVIKVLPFLVDRDGNHALTPSLFERDGYQDFLRRHPEKVATMLIDVQWKTKGRAVSPLKLRVELRGTPQAGTVTGAILEQPVQASGHSSHWTSLPLAPSRYHDLNAVTAWRATLWEGDELLGEQKSFLW